MAGYVGRGINYGNAVADHFTGNGGATYTLTYDTTTDGVVISLDGVVQRNSTDFNIAGTALTFTSTVASPIAIQVIYTGLTQAIGVPGDNTVSGSKIAMGSDAQGDVLYYNGTDYVRLPKGTASQVLKMNSGATAPEWAADADTTNTNASNLVSGTLPDGRFPATLPATSGVNLTALNATNLGSGTVPDARFPATLPTASGTNLTSLNASNLGSGTVPTARLGSGTASSSTFLRGDQTYAEAGGGKVLQVVSATKTDTTTTTSTSFTTISGLSVDITPASSSNKVLVFWNLNVNGNNDGSCMAIIRASTLIAIGDASGSTIQCTANTYTTLGGQIKNVAGQHLDSPSTTSQTTYAIQWRSEGSTDYLNRAESEGTSDRCVSSITVMEIGA